MKGFVTNISIPAILEISNGAAFSLDRLLRQHGFGNALFLFDEFTYQHHHEDMLKSIASAEVETLLLPDDSDIQDLIQKAFELKQFDVVIAMGGGKVIDFGKYMAFVRRSPFLSIPTSASNDGFASSNCSLLIAGKKTTVPAKVPYGIIADLDIIQHVPDRFILAGIGDLMSNITALVDWEFEERHGAGAVNHFAHMLSKKAVNSFIRTPMTDLRSPILLKELISSLTMGGIAAVISGNSSPISGAEHLISHALDKIAEKPVMHGMQVGVATYLMARVQEHRVERMVKVFTRTGFFAYAKELGLKKAELRQAIEMAPSIKPNRYTYLHDEGYRQKALQLLEEDSVLQELLT
ncbi:iron-containing alcohol dehydrogenase family protein [Ectobacillus ponti]|uniref:Iron-containing alcohol dehydrogenase family protein n=1 Tax=Ectobacillus ponti TaxID=2961894 RepID=A0AA41XBE7_9BACI|nr:iron-containing alcohol dehydrogenase family protein [Ectobacillus ponti]MCP8969788.1 iron-containing alcohol dehydrogenase family protein [Ectobacillus ponti]